VTQGTHTLRLHGFFPYPASQPKDGAIPRDKRREGEGIREFEEGKRKRDKEEEMGWIFVPSPFLYFRYRPKI